MLPQGMILGDGQYRIEKILGSGGFGITYLATDLRLRRAVAIKEYFPRMIAQRDPRDHSLFVTGDPKVFEAGLRHFHREGSTLYNLKHPNIVTVMDLFAENGTAYLVMEYLAGRSLKDELVAAGGKGLDEGRVWQVMEGLVSALAIVHSQGIRHLDIKPGNVMCLDSGKIVLIDFGSARVGQSIGTDSRFALSRDYAPVELFFRQTFGPESDLYEVGVLLYQMLTGKLPPDAIQRYEGVKWHPGELSEPWRTMVLEATRVKPEERPTDIRAWWQHSYLGRNRQASGSAPRVFPPPVTVYLGGAVMACGLFSILAITLGGGNNPATQGVSAATPAAETATATPPPKPAYPQPKDLKVNSVDGAEVVWVPPGEFMRGSMDGSRDERPRQKVFLSGYWIYRYPVTVAQYRKFCQVKGKDMPRAPKWGWKDDHPIVNVTWEDARAYASWAGGSLPTEAQWEKAARGSEGGIYPWGNDWESNRGVNGTNSSGSTAPVRRDTHRDDSPFAVIDMAGNVEQWCQDWYNAYSEAKSPDRDPVIDESVTRAGERVVRGAGWDNKNKKDFRGAARAWDYRLNRASNRGFRLVVGGS